MEIESIRISQFRPRAYLQASEVESRCVRITMIVSRVYTYHKDPNSASPSVRGRLRICLTEENNES